MSEKKLDTIIEKLDVVDSRIDRVDITLARHEENLKEHIRRTAIAEENIDLLRQEVEPIKAHVNKVSGAFMLVGAISTMLGIAVAIFEVYNYIKR